MMGFETGFDLILLCAGDGTRYGEYKPLAEINSLPVFMHTYNCFKDHPLLNKTIFVVKKEELKRVKHWILPETDKIDIVLGGDYRHKSVQIGTERVISPFVLIHDGVRPIIRKSLIDNLLKELSLGTKCVVPYVRSVNTIFKETRDKTPYSAYPNKLTLRELHTPQAFDGETLKDMMKDELFSSTFYESYHVEESYIYFKKFGVLPSFIDSYPENHKLTYPCDLGILRVLMERERAIQKDVVGDED